MNKKRILTVLSASLLLAACGGDGDEKELSREYGVVLQINGSTNISNKSITKVTLNRDNAGEDFEDCLQEIRDSNNTVIGTVPYYDNYEALGGESSAYCDGTRVNVTSNVTFQIRFLNNTYEEMPITYKGVGVEIRVYDESDVEVWNSIIVQDLSNQFYEQGVFDPEATFSRTLKAGEAFPNQRNFPISYTFTGDGNYADNIDPGVYLLEEDFQALEWVQGDYDHSQSGCEPFNQQPGSTLDTQFNVTRRYNKPICQTIPLPAGQYRVRIEYSFTPAVDPVEFYITLNPET